MEFFHPPFTEPSIKDQFKKLVKKHHPDKGGNEDTFKRMKQEHENLVKAIKKHSDPPKPSKKKKMVRKPVKIRHIHILVDGNDIINQFIKKLWN